MRKLFTERYGIVPARVGEELTPDAATALLGLVNSRIEENWFGESFPLMCPDGGHNSGVDVTKLEAAMKGYRLVWPKDCLGYQAQQPTDPEMFDILEFSYEHVAQPKDYGFHSYFSHDHFTYDVDAGRARFAEDVNRIFERQGLALEMREGEIIRLAPTGLQEALASTVFNTGDKELDRLLETAREKFFNKSADTRKEGLEKLWDAWERLKTIEPGNDKKAQITALLDRAASEPLFRERLEVEARELTMIGNSFMIRHTEIGKPALATSAQVDYLFHRMFAMIRLLLKSSSRGG
jgi:hypothetical protein